jgi:hypothetical protein
MYQKMWSEREFPKEWRRVMVISILKPGKKPTDTESYSSCKILERILNKRLLYVLQSKNLLLEQQYNGFRKGRSTTDVLIILENNIAVVLKLEEK